MSHTVDRAIDDIRIGMRQLRETLKGIPHRANGFRNTHANLTRDVAFLMVQLESARGQFRGRN
jgi:hypothetical protein